MFVRCCSLSRKIKIVHPRPSFPFFCEKRAKKKRPPPPKKKKSKHSLFLSLSAKKRVPSPLPSFLPSFHPSILPSTLLSRVHARSFVVALSISRKCRCALFLFFFFFFFFFFFSCKNLSMATAAANEDDGEKRTNASCYCGKIQMEIRGRPVAVSICHCTVCRRLSGGAFSIQSLHSKNNFSAQQKRWTCGLFSPRRTLLDIDVRSAGVLFMLL